MKDLHNNLRVESLIDAATLAADNTPPAVDRRGYDSVMIALAIGAGGITFTGTNKIEFVLTHSDDNSTYTAVTIDDVDGVSSVGTGGIIKSLTAAKAASSVHRFGYKGNKRYIKLLADFSGTHATGTPIAAMAVMGHAGLTPVADQA